MSNSPITPLSTTRDYSFRRMKRIDPPPLSQLSFHHTNHSTPPLPSPPILSNANNIRIPGSREAEPQAQMAETPVSAAEESPVSALSPASPSRSVLNGYEQTQDASANPRSPVRLEPETHGEGEDDHIQNIHPAYRVPPSQQWNAHRPAPIPEESPRPMGKSGKTYEDTLTRNRESIAEQRPSASRESQRLSSRVAHVRSASAESRGLAIVGAHVRSASAESRRQKTLPDIPADAEEEQTDGLGVRGVSYTPQGQQVSVYAPPREQIQYQQLYDYTPQPAQRQQQRFPVRASRAPEQHLRSDSASTTQSGSSVSPAEKVKFCDVPNDWDTKPSPLQHDGKFAVMLAVGDAIMALLPIAFIVLGICVARLHGQKVEGNPFGQNVKSIMNLGPTIFPIMFAAVAGKALKIMARFFAEKGAKLGILELLMASQTVWGTFESQLLLKNFSILGANLFILWALSPIGGQASLRVLGFGDSTTSNQTQIVYMPSGGMRSEQMAESALFTNANTVARGTLGSLYSALLTAPLQDKQLHRDFWGNVKIPRIESYDGATADSDGWISVPSNQSASSFSSLVGIPIVGFRDADQSTFQMSAAYMTVDCPMQWDVESTTDEPWLDLLGRLYSGKNMSDVFGSLKLNSQTTFFLDTKMPASWTRQEAAFLDMNETMAEDPDLQTPMSLLFGSLYWADGANGTQMTIRNCTLGSRYIDASLTCAKGDCAVARIRPSVKYAKRSSLFTPLEASSVFANLARYLPMATGTINWGKETDATLTELYIRDPTKGIAADSIPPLLKTVSRDDFNIRLAQILNTYLQLSYDPVSFVGNLPPFSNITRSFTVAGADDEPVFGYSNSRAGFHGFATNATNTIFMRVYECNFLWLGLLETSAIILLLVGIAGLNLKLRCKAPEMMGFVASMTYDNPYVVLPRGGNVYQAMERAQLLKGMDVRIGDVKRNETIGHIAFASVRGNTHIGELEKGRLYV